MLSSVKVLLTREATASALMNLDRSNTSKKISIFRKKNSYIKTRIECEKKLLTVIVKCVGILEYIIPHTKTNALQS